MSTFDVAAFRPLVKGQALSEQTLFGTDGGVVLTGADKVAQRALTRMNTELKEVPFLNEGTSFLSTIRRSRVNTEMELFQLLTLACSQVMKQMRADTLPEDPPEERVTAISVTRVLLRGEGNIDAEVLIRTAATTAVVVTVPVRIQVG